MNQITPVRTPCIGICSATSVGDRICRGCKRFAFEVIDWNSYTEEQKRSILLRLEKLIVPIVETRFIIRSAPDLAAGLKRLGVPLQQDAAPQVWLHSLLKKRFRRVDSLTDFGVEVRPPWQSMTLAALVDEMDAQLLLLCDAHLQRYFPDRAGADLVGPTD